MRIFRRIISVFSIALLLVAVVYGFLWLRTRTILDYKPAECVPADFSICLKINDMEEILSMFREENPLFGEILESGAFMHLGELSEFLVEIDSLHSGKPELKEIFSGEAYLSMHEEEGEKRILFSTESTEHKARDTWMKNLGDQNSIDKRNYESITYYYVEYPERDFLRNVAFFETKGVFTAANSEELLKASIRQINSKEVVFDLPGYQKIFQTAGTDVPANLIINYSQSDAWINSFFPQGKEPDAGRIFNSSVLDIETNSDNIILNGFTGFYGTEDSLYLNFSDVPPGFDLLKHIPYDPVYFDIMKGMKIIPEGKSGFLQKFGKGLKNESACFLLKEGQQYGSCLMISLTSGSSTEEVLKNELNRLINKEGPLTPEIVSIDQFDFRLYNIKGIPLASELNIPRKAKREYEFFTVHNNVLIMSERLQELKKVLFAGLLGTTLNNSDEFIELSSQFSSSSNRFVYFNLPLLFENPDQFFNREFSKRIKNGKESLMKFNALSFQSTQSDDLHYFRIFLNYAGEIRERVNTVWQRKLDTLSTFKPVIVKNHNTGEKEIFIQDLMDNIYLIGSSGNILWKQKIDGQILGQVHQVDYYNNGKLQYLFNTPAAVYLLDRNGNNVENFPVRLREMAVAGISLFDYDKKGEWRIPVPTADKRIYMYDRKGKLVTGWKFRKSDYIIDQALMHIRLGNLDYIIAREEFQIYFLDRKGKKRIIPEQQLHFSPNPVFFENFGGKPSILASEVNGSVYRFYFDRKVEKVMEQDLKGNHHFLAEDINGDQKKEFIFLNGKRIRVYDQNGKLLFEEILPEEIELPPVVYSFSSNDKKIGVVATKSGKIYLYNKDGSQYSGFPLLGSSMYSISSFPGLKGRFNLLVSNNDNFLYNYSVQ